MVSISKLAVVIGFLLMTTADSFSAIAFRSVATSTVVSGNATVSRPAGIAVGDLMVTAIAVRSFNVTVTPPSATGSWSQLRRDNNTLTTANALVVYYKIASSVDVGAASYVWTFSSNTGAAVATLAFSGVDTNSPFNANAGQFTIPGYQHSTPAITTSSNGCMVVSCHGYASSNPWTAPSGTTMDANIATLTTPNANGMSLCVDHVLQTSAGSIGPLTATVPNDANVDAGNASIFALNPLAVTLPTLGSPLVVSNRFQFTLTGASGSVYAIYATTNLASTNWTMIQTGAAPFIYSEPLTNSRRFYRGATVP